MADDFNREYYEKFSPADSYNAVFPIRRALKMRSLFLPAEASVICFGFDHIIHFKQWRKEFKHVYAYDINPVVEEEALKHGITTIKTRDATIPLDDDCQKADLAACYYLFEHLSDEQCKSVILNMAKSAPLNMLIITAGDDERYPQDPTHCNPKTNREWGRFLAAAYKSLGWKRIFSRYNNWAFASSALAYAFESLPSVFAADIEKAWRGKRYE